MSLSVVDERKENTMKVNALVNVELVRFFTEIITSEMMIEQLKDEVYTLVSKIVSHHSKMNKAKSQSEFDYNFAMFRIVKQTLCHLLSEFSNCEFTCNFPCDFDSNWFMINYHVRTTNDYVAIDNKIAIIVIC